MDPREDVLVEHDGLRFRCRLDGPEGGPWLVFSNSLLTHFGMWDEPVLALSEQYRVLRYDQRGHGGTEIPAYPSRIEQLAEDAAALLEHFAVESATFVGVSMGAATALCLAGRRHKRIARLIACDGQAKAPPTAPSAWEERIALARREGMDALAEATVRRWCRPDFVATNPPVLATLRAMIAATPLDGFIACAHALQDYDLRELLPQIAVPTLLIAGADDGNIPVAMRTMLASIPGAMFREIPWAGHLPSLEQPRIFLDAVREFLGQTS
jgi:3-oxoadipate enol-lactonase